jgi:hypothetical protein
MENTNCPVKPQALVAGNASRRTQIPPLPAVDQIAFMDEGPTEGKQRYGAVVENSGHDSEIPVSANEQNWSMEFFG